METTRPAPRTDGITFADAATEYLRFVETFGSGIFKRAKRVWGLADNPASADLVERPKVTYTGEFDTFDRDEIERLVVAAENEQDAAIYRVAAFTGLRMGELLALRWSDVDFVDGLLHVRATSRAAPRRCRRERGSGRCR